ncbi:carnitine O-acetyltransferase-like isoform X2 [Archocentrus centrarchus]|nr:carnitine O-acetyltransferase-like isoform X2 [Archocentrus centrarchus]
MGNPCGLVKSCRLSLVSGRYLNYWKGLPHLPVPPLRETCERYLSALEPIVKEDELKQTTRLMEEFLKEGGDGEKLQKSLERKACTTDNWLTDHGLQTQYLDRREPLVVFSNFGFALPQMDFRDKLGQIRCAAKLITAVLDFKTMIDNETLPVEYMRGEPLCMMQYCQALSSCCIPGLKTDSLVFHGKSSNAPKHITVAHNSQFFTVEVYNSDGTPITVDQLCVQLERICNSPLETNMELVGILTTLRRDSWAKWYDRLVQDPSNRESVSAIERSICMLCLDGAMPQVYGKSGRCAALQMLHGGGSQWNSANRWFDKSLQFIIGEGGTCGLNILHAVIDGTASLALADHITASMKKPQMMPSPVELLPMPQKLHFNITPDIKNVIEEAKQSMDKIAEDLDLRVLVFSHFGKIFIKAYKLSPDAFVQMAIQLAYYRIYQQCCASYEAASMRLFRKGRLGVIMSTSSASAAFVKSFDDPKKQSTEKLELLEKAIKVHRWNTNMEIRGQIIYGHILALKNQAIEDDIPMPGIFTDPSLDKAFNFRLSTSQMSSKTGCLCFAGPDQPEVYDFCYSFTDDDITFVGSAWKSCKENNVIQLIQTLEDALLDMRMLLENETSSA